MNPRTQRGLFAALFVLFSVSGIACGSSTSSTTVSAIALSPSPCGMTRTNSVQMSALATLTDGTKVDIGKSSSAVWSAANTDTATASSSGVVVGVNVGVTTITVAYLGATGSLDCTITP
jgi:hypothetical protein